jgi:D-alanyl-D-alanine carboxypeptidase
MPSGRDGVEYTIEAWRKRTPVPAVVVAVGEHGHFDEIFASGTTTKERTAPVEPDARFRVGSITKTFVATVVLQLVQEGSIELNDPVVDWVDAVPGVDQDAYRSLTAGVTIRQLLAHTSGIPDYGRVPGLGPTLLENRSRRWTTADVLNLVADRDREFAPGGSYSYSNTNYVLLGEVIGSATDHSWWSEVRRRILHPLGLKETFIPSFESYHKRIVPGYFDTDGDGFTNRIPGTSWPALETSEGAAGDLVSTAGDLLRFTEALAGGRLVSRQQLSMMTRWGAYGTRHSGYGLGVEVLRPDYRTTVWGHGGSVPGYRSVLWYVPSLQSSVVVLTNESRSNPAGLAELIMNAL